MAKPGRGICFFMGIIKYEYEGSEIQFEEVNGQLMANATAMCSAFGKRPSKWLELESTKRYIKALQSKSGNRTIDNQLVTTMSPGVGAGTWIHEKLILKLAQWLDVNFEVWCDEKLAELMKTGKVELKPMSTEEMIIAQAQSVIQVKRELAEVRQEVKELAAKVITHPTDYFTVAGYASLKGVKMDLVTASEYGRKASKVCKDNGYPTGTTPDPRFGKVKTYPVEALDIAFK